MTILTTKKKSLCPVCGEKSYKIGFTKDGRVIRSCNDATNERK